MEGNCIFKQTYADTHEDGGTGEVVGVEKRRDDEGTDANEASFITFCPNPDHM